MPELHKPVLPPLATAPSAPVEGQVYYDSVKNAIGVYNGASWDYTQVVEDTTPVLGGDLDLGAFEILLESVPAADVTASGIKSSVTVDANATGVGALLFLAADGNYEEADADLVTTMPGLVLALESGTGTKEVLHVGYIRQDSWTWVLVAGEGNLLYASTTAGAMTQTAPSASGDQVQILGYATHADRMFFNPSFIMVEIT